MASPTHWRWVCVNSGSWCWTWRPGVLQFMGSQRVEHNWATELNWTNIYWGLGTSKFIVYLLSLLNEEIYIKDLCVCVCAQMLSHVRLCDPMDCSPSGSSVHGISQARILELSAISFSRGSSTLHALRHKLLNLSVFQSPVIWRLIYPPHNIFVRIKWRKLKHIECI